MTVNHNSSLEVLRRQRTEGRMREGRSKISKRSLGTEPQPMEEEQGLLTTESALQFPELSFGVNCGWGREQ